jgi:hypothetical protein
MEDEELPTLEQDLATINQRASEARALAALPPQMGAGGGNPMASRVQGAAEGLIDSPMGKWGKALESTSGWVKNLPKNFGLGVLDAATNTAKAAFDMAEMTHPTAGAGAEAAKGAPPPEELRAVNDGPADPFAQVLDSEVPAAYEAWRESLRDDDSMADSLTQGLAQFAVPFTGFTKALGGGLKAGWLANVMAGTVADAATSATAFDPHAGRLADLIELGRHSEGKLGDALRIAAPDGGLVNRYVDWMTARDNEGEMEGRFKNAVDGTVASLVVAGFIKTAAGTLKQARQLPEKFAKNVANAPGKGRMARQEGKIVFHGTPHDFDEFSLDKIGTGEGNQSFGHGLYFAENAKVAKTYQERLSSRNWNDAGYKGLAYRTMEAVKWKGVDAVKELQKRAAASGDREFSQKVTQAIDFIKSGNVARARGKLMSVEIPDEQIDKMLDWDAPFSAQPKNVQDALLSLGMKNRSGQDIVERIKAGLADPSGDEVYRMLGGSPDEASKKLREAGVPGIRFFDGGSRGNQDGTRNIVLFDEKLATIVGKE